MIFLCALMGLLIGTFLNWASDYLPRFTTSGVDASFNPFGRLRAGSPPSPGSALWRLLTSSVSQRNLTRLQKPSLTWTWLDVAVELFTALLFACLWARFRLSWRLLVMALTCAFFLLIAIIDLKYRLVLNVLVYPAAVVALLLHSVPPGRNTLITLLGGAVGLSPFLLVALLKPGSIGGGDIKLAALIGLVTGFPQVLWAVTLGILAGGITAFALLLTRRWGPGSYIPYAPFLCLGAVFSLVYDPLSLLFPL